MKNELLKNELFKSTLIGLLALIALVCWLRFQPTPPEIEPKEKIGRKLFETFDDPEKMRRVEFVGVDPENGGEIQTLTLVRDGAVWRLDQLTGFPAENAERLAKIVAPLAQLSVLDVADEATRDEDAKKIAKFHEECGVLDPATAADLDSPCAALSIRIDGENGERLVDLIVGARAPESSATRDVRYVRVRGDDVVYVADFSGESTQEVGTTEFDEFPRRVSFAPIDWTDRDLLRISRWDVATLTVRDYVFQLKKTDDDATLDFQSSGLAAFQQTPENSLSRIWSLARRWNRTDDGAWKEATLVDPESANNEVLNETADALAGLKIVDVRKKPTPLAKIFRENQLGAELTTQAAALEEFGFAFADYDPLQPEKIEPSLIGEAGAIELTMKDGAKIALLFGKKIGETRACLAFATFDRAALAESIADESELEFLAPDAEQKVDLKNARLADWFYLISEEDFQKIQFRIPSVLKTP